MVHQIFMNTERKGYGLILILVSKPVVYFSRERDLFGYDKEKESGEGDKIRERMRTRRKRESESWRWRKRLHLIYAFSNLSESIITPLMTNVHSHRIHFPQFIVGLGWGWGWGWGLGCQDLS